MDLQQLFAEETEADSDLPLRVGIGIDSGEAIALEDGSFRGAALNVASRLCALAHGGEVLVSEGTSRLAGAASRRPLRGQGTRQPEGHRPSRARDARGARGRARTDSPMDRDVLRRL